MTQCKAFSALAAVWALAACQQQAPESDAALVGNAPTAEINKTIPVVLPDQPTPKLDIPALPGQSGSETSAPITVPPLTDEAEKGEKGARAVLLDFARAIEFKRFDQAYGLLSPADRQRWSRADFAAIFKDLGKLTVAVPTGTMEGAAGSSYYTAPMAITSSDKEGRPVRIEGEAVLRRVNGVDGATPAQLRWHFDRLTLDWTH